MKSILDPSFRYVPAVETDIRKTFDRIRREQVEEQKRREKVVELRQPNGQTKAR